MKFLICFGLLLASPLLAQDGPTSVFVPDPVINKVAKGLSGALVTRDGQKLKPFDAKTLQGKKYLALYFSASWCPPCRGFTPELVSFYQNKKADHDKFDIIFISSDRTEDAMLGYMVSDRMEWPALAFNRKQTSSLTKYSGDGIPCLVILDENGKVLSDSYKGTEYIGPRKVLRDLDKLLSES